MQNGITDLEATAAGGSASGYAVDTDQEQLPNWLSVRHHIDDPNLLSDLRSRFGRIAFLNNINVAEGFRGKGVGSGLLDRFIDEACDDGAEAILLLADAGETQREGFSLVAWYESRDFIVLTHTPGGPLMLLDLS